MPNPRVVRVSRARPQVNGVRAREKKLRRWLKKRRTGDGSDIPVEYPDAELQAEPDLPEPDLESELPWELALGDT